MPPFFERRRFRIWALPVVARSRTSAEVRTPSSAMIAKPFPAIRTASSTCADREGLLDHAHAATRAYLHLRVRVCRGPGRVRVDTDVELFSHRCAFAQVGSARGGR